MSTTSIIPEGYTFANPWNMMTKKSFERFKDLMEKMANRDPDRFDMYIYNDFYGYAQVDLINTELSAIHACIVKRDWNEAYVLLEALTAVLNYALCVWPMVDDGELTELVDQTYGASLVTLMRALEKEGRLNVDNFPALENVLKQASKWGRGMPSPGVYRIVLQGIGKRLFGNKSEETVALEKARVEEWTKNLSEDEREQVQTMLEEGDEDEDEDEEEMGEDKKPWWDDGPANEDYKDTELTLSRVWKEYRAHLRQYPSVPMRGPSWDINTWSAKDKAPFLFDNMDSD